MVLLDVEEADPGSPAPPMPGDAAEAKLSETRERLQGTVEEYVAALEELKSANEELVSVSEEAHDSLEAFEEEMQSLNEGTNTIDAELTGKIDELDTANSDLRNLFGSTQIATVFVDAHLVIRTLPRRRRRCST